jgi:hypothetical protein
MPLRQQGIYARDSNNSSVFSGNRLVNMASIHLYTPQQILTYSAFIDIRPRHAQVWIDGLPAANLKETAQRVRTALLEINKVKMATAQRHALLAQFVKVVDRLGNGLRATYRSSPLPPSEDQLESINLLQQIYASMANGYKILVSEVQRSGKGMEAGNQGFMEAMCGATEYLSLQLIQAYEVYFPEPKRVWGELHYLYLLAERERILDVRIKPQFTKGSVGLSLGERYKRAVMITLANPYHLIQGECSLLYNKLGAWARQITLTPWRGGVCPAGRFFIDMGTDAAPRYAPSAMQLKPIYPYLVEVGDVLEILKRLVADLRLGEGEGQDKRVSFNDRKLRSMYERAAMAWGGRQERLGTRTHGMSDTVMLMGLSNCYRLFAEIAPELELTQADTPEPEQQKKKPPKDSGLRLMAIEDHVRQASRQVDADLDSDEDQGQGYAPEEVVVGDTEIEIVFGDAEGDAPIMEEDTSRWRQRNQSQGGVSLFCFMDCVAPARVGEIIAFRPSSSRWNEDWRIGAVRWIRVQPGQGMEMGVRTLAEDSAAVRSKAVIGIGVGGVIGRCLMVPWGDPRTAPANLITPPGIYDEGTILALELRPDTVIPVRLDNLVDSSNRYSQLRFSCLDKPPRVDDWDAMS